MWVFGLKLIFHQHYGGTDKVGFKVSCWPGAGSPEPTPFSFSHPLITLLILSDRYNPAPRVERALPSDDTPCDRTFNMYIRAHNEVVFSATPFH